VKRPRVFLLSPANAGGERARMLLSDRAQFDLAVRLRRESAPLSDVYAFVSGLYFRGKLAYSAAFGCPPAGIPPAAVVTPGCGLVPPETPVTREQFLYIAAVPIALDNPRYLTPLIEHACLLNEAAGPDCDFVLLGSVATSKYLEPLLEIFGDRLLFPPDFVGRGDMSRGGLMLRCARAGVELAYAPVRGAVLHGKRPPRLPKIR
jgi:hypothetical protein